ncbi:MAG: rRNA pseudouridine synthase [Lachnospiraceae bacterium]|nr:rRNA pseudouridine synthase [Lachnospiraceae bacterium]
MRIDKFLADNSIGTRREIKALIRAGRITAGEDVVSDPGMHIDPEKDIISYDGNVISYEKNHYFMLNKPSGVVSSTKEGASRTVVELLSGEGVKGLSPVGRLDKDTEGLLLLTDDGALLHDLISPSKHVEKEYLVITESPVGEDDMERLREGVDIGDDKPTLPAKAFMEGDGLHLVICEGRFHQVKRMLEAVGNRVVYLKRLRMGGLKLDEQLEKGGYRKLSPEEISLLQKGGKH